MTTEKLRVGLAGAGWVMSARHVPAYRAHPRTQIVAVYDRQLERARSMARTIGDDVAAYNNLHDFLDHSRLDVVSIATSPWSHRDIAVAALAHGANVFTEKPMAMDSAEALEMSQEAQAADRLLCVSHNFLFSRSVERTDAMLCGATADYVAGVQLSSEARRLPTWYRDLPGGLMFDEVPHMLYTINHFLGGNLRLDHARATLMEDGHPRTVDLLLRGNTGVGQIAMVFSAPVSEWHLNVTTPRVVASMDLFRDIAVRIKPDGRHGAVDIAKTSASVVGGHLAGFARSGGRLLTGRQHWGHDVLIARFVDAVLGLCSNPVPVASALQVVAVTDDVLSSLDLRAGARH